MVTQGREWSPRGPAEVWLVLWHGDWGTEWELFGNELLAQKRVVKFIRERLPKIGYEEVASSVREALKARDFEKAFQVFTDHESGWGNRLEIEKVRVQH